MTEFYDRSGAEKSLEWFTSTYGAVVKTAESSFKFSLARVDCLPKTGAMTVRVIREDGTPVSHQQVAISWPDPTLGAFSSAYKRAWRQRGRMQYTGEDGYTGFGMSDDMAIKPVVGGPFSFWILSLSADSDGLVGVGLAPDGTGPFALTFVLVGEEPAVEPVPDPEPTPDPDPLPEPEPLPEPGLYFKAEVTHGLHLIPRHWSETDRVRLITMAAKRIKIVADDETIPHIDSIPKTCDVIIRNYPMSEQMDRTFEREGVGKRFFENEAEAYARGLAHAEICNRIATWAEANGLERSRQWYEGINEPEFWSGEPPILVAAYYDGFLDGCHRYNIGAVVLNAGVGWPGTYDGNSQYGVDWSQLERMHRKMTSRDLLGLHQYFGMGGPWAVWEDGKLRWASEAGRHLQCPWMDVKIVLTEHGLDDGVNRNAKSGWHDIKAESFDAKVILYMDMLKWCFRQYVADGRVVGIYVFTYDYASNDWEKFNIRHDLFIEAYAKWMEDGEMMLTWGDNRTARWEELVKLYATNEGLDPLVVGTIIAIESAGKIDALSSAGAVGLMQIMSSSAIAGRPDKKWLLQPDNNIRYGCGILKSYLNYYGGDLAKALAAYNAGPGNIDAYGLDWDAPKIYLGMFVKAWQELWPPNTCPISIGEEPVDAEFVATMLTSGEAHQLIQFNKDAALQKRAFADGFVVNSNEYEINYRGIDYVAQRAEHMGSGVVRVYYCVKGDWANVGFVERPVAETTELSLEKSVNKSLVENADLWKELASK